MPRAKTVHDKRETHRPAPVVLPTRTMTKVNDRMRLIRQGDNREMAVFEAAVKKGKGVRPWRLSTEHANLFRAASLMREEEDRQKEKIMYAAGMHIDAQVPIAGTGATTTSRDIGANTNKEAGVAATTAATEGGQKRENAGPISPPEGRKGPTAKVGASSQHGGGGSGGYRLANEAPGAEAEVDPDKDDRVQSPSGVFDPETMGGSVPGQVYGSGSGQGAGRDWSSGWSQGDLHGLDIENGVRKRVLNLVGARELDRIQSTFRASGGRLERQAFIEALLWAACGDDGDVEGTDEDCCCDGGDEQASVAPAAPLVSVAPAEWCDDRCVGREKPSVIATTPAAASASASAAAAAAAAAELEAAEAAASTSPSAGAGACIADANMSGHVAVPPAHRNTSRGFRARWSNEAVPHPERMQSKLADSAPDQMVVLYGRLFELISLQHGDWTTWDELSNFLLFDDDSGRTGGHGGPRQYLPAGSVHIPKILGLESAIVFNVSRAGQELDVAAFLVRHSASFIVAGLDGLSSSSPSPPPVRVKGHSGQVLAMAFVAAPFNVLVTSGEKDRMLRCWDMILKPKLDAVVGPAGKRQAKACEPQVMLKWLRAPPSGGVDPSRCSDGGGGNGSDSKGNGAADVSAILVSGGAGGTVNIWQLTAKHLEILNTLPGHTGAVTSACVLPHPEVFVTGSLDADIRVWATKTYKFKRVMKGHSRGVVTIDYSPTQRVIVSAGFDHDILVWSPVAGQVICRLSGHGCSLVAARVSAVSSDVISVSMDGIIKVWDSANFKCVQTIHSHRQQERRPGASSSFAGRGGERAGHGGGGGKMQWGKATQDGGETKTKSKASFAPGGGGVVDLFLFEGETSRLLVCRGTELDFHDNGRAGEKDVTDSNQTIDVIYHSETGTFASVASTGVKLWDARTGRLTRVYGVPPRPSTFSSGGRWAKRRRAGLGAAGGVGFSRVVDVNGDGGDAEGTGRFRLVEAGEAEEITSACIDSRGHQIVMGFNTGRVACARYLTGRLVGQLDFHPGEVTDVAGVWNDACGALVLSASDATASLQKLAVDVAEPRRTIMVLDPALEAIRMERSNQIVEGTVVNVAGAVKQLMVGAKILRAKKTFLTTLDSFRERNWRSDSSRGGTAGEAAAWSGAPTIATVTDTNSSTSTLLTREGGGIEMPSGVSSNMGGQPTGGGGQGEGGRARQPGKCDSNMFIDEDNTNSASGDDRTSERQIAARSGKGNHGNNSRSVRIAGVGGAIAEDADFTDEDKEVVQQAGGGKVEELRSPRAVAGVPTAASATVGGMTPTPPAGQKPRPSASSLFNKKFAKRFLRSGGGGGGSSSSRSDRLRQRDGENQESPLGRRCRHVQGGTGGEGQGHDGGGANNKGGDDAGGKKRDGRGGDGGRGGKDAPVNMGSRFRSHITTVAVSHMYQLAATGSLNGNVIVWDVQKGPSTRGLAILEAHNGYQVNSICFLEPHAALVTCNLEGTIAVWRMGPAPDPLKDYRGLGEESGGQGSGDDDDRRIDATTTAAGRAARGAGGGDPVVATIRAGNKGRRRATGERMAPSSEWRCVALFFNNNTAPPHAAHAFPGEGLGVGGCSQGQKVSVPAAVNSLAWSSLEERLFTGDAVGFVKVWDIKGALTSPGTEDEPRQVAKISKDRISKMVHNGSSSITIDSSTITGEDEEKEKERKENDDNQQNNPPNDNYNDTITTITTTTATDNPDNINNDIDVDINAMVAMKHEEEENEGPETPSHRGSAQLTACTPAPSMAPFDGNLRDDLSSLGPADGDATSSEEDDGIGMNGGSKAAGTSSSAHGEHSTLWSSESSESISGEDYGDRFGRGVGLRFVRRLDEWRPGKEGRQEVTKVKVFEGQSVSFRGVAIVGRDHPRPGADNHSSYRGNRRRPTTKSGTVIVATITPDKLVRFWDSGGNLLGSLDQEYVASPHQTIAARPLASWRMCVGASDAPAGKPDGDDWDGADDNASTGRSPPVVALTSPKSARRESSKGDAGSRNAE